MKSENYLRVTTDISDIRKDSLLTIDKQIEESFTDQATAIEYIGEILNLMHKAFETDKIQFVENVFFEHHISIRKTQLHQERLLEELQRAKSFENSKVKKVHLINLYRNAVADLFDPQLSLIVACLEFIEGSFTSYLESNLGAGERSKYEYCLKRLKPTNLFKGYNSIVRNSISHAGTDSIIYEEKSIVFRNIKRGRPPSVEYVEWSEEDLAANISFLLNFSYGIDCAINIFGIDLGAFIYNTPQLSHKFLDEVLSKEHRKEIQVDFDQVIEKISFSDTSSRYEKIESISIFYFLECKKRKMATPSLKYGDENKILLITTINSEHLDYADDNELIIRMLELLQYSIIAYPCFKLLFENYFILDTTEPSKQTLEVRLKGSEISLYNLESASLLDLLEHAEVFLNRKRIFFEIDFALNKKLAYEKLDRIFPQKSR